MNKFVKWLKSSASDFVLFVLILVLANIAGRKAFLRFDLTTQGAYSISPASRNTVKTLTEPLSIKVMSRTSHLDGYRVQIQCFLFQICHLLDLG